MRKQQGFMLIGMLIALGFATIFFSMIAENMVIKQIRDQQAIPYKERLLNLKNQIENYQAVQFQANPNIVNNPLLFPRNLKELETKGFLPKCSHEDIRRGRCADINKTPWDSTISYQRKRSQQGAFYFAEITIPLPNKNSDGRLYNAFTSVLGSLPDIRFNSSETALLWRINRISDLPAFSAQLDQYVKRDGSSTLTGDWDVGNRAILNAKALSVNIGGGYQQRVDAGVVGAFMAKPGTPITKHRCASGLKPVLMVGVASNGDYYYSQKFAETGAYKAAYEDAGNNRWKLTYIQYVKKVLSDGTLKWQESTSNAQLNVLRLCIPERQRWPI
ncbi:type II secretion system protein [Photobacterium damselae]|nr:type II secretion system protein [Photobacterium damselae]